MSLTSRLGFGLSLSLFAGLSAPMIAPTMSRSIFSSNRFTSSFAQAQTVQAQTPAFSDVSADYWAHDYIQGLAKSNIISGFGDGTFKPNELVTRAQFAAILRKAFLQSQPTAASPFADVSSNYWASNAIYAARSAGFLSGYPGNKFGPNDFITRENALISLAKGLKYAEGSPDVLSAYRDVDSISNYALPGVRSAAQAGLIVNYPDVDSISPYSPGSRADVAAFVYQALVKAGRAEPLAAKDRWNRKPVVTLPTISAKMSLSQTGQQLATIVANYTDNDTVVGERFQIWDTQTGQLIKEIAAPAQTRFNSIAISHDGTSVATVSINPSTNDTRLSVWTVATGEQLWQKPLDTPQPTDYPFYFDQSLVQVAFTPDNSEIVTQLVVAPKVGSPANNQLRFYQAATGEAIQSLDSTTISGTQITQIAFSPSGQFFASAKQEGVVDVWRLNGENRFEFFKTLSTGTAKDMVFTSNDTLNVSTVNSQEPYVEGRLSTWNIQTDDKPSRTYPTYWDRTGRFTESSPDGQYYFVRSDIDGSRLINVQTGEQQGLGGEYSDTAAVFSGSGDYLAIAGTGDISIFAKKTTSNP